MADEKDRFGETMKLLERAKEDIYFAERDRELIEKLKQQLKKAEKGSSELRCPKCPGHLETYSFQGFVLERCQSYGGVWMDEGELEGIVRTLTQGSIGPLDRQIVGQGRATGSQEMRSRAKKCSTSPLC